MKRTIQYILIGAALAVSCTKTKTDILPGNRPTTVNMAPSTIRLMLPTGYELVVNDDTLTNWRPPAYYDTAGHPPIPVNPTPWFPATGKTSGPWYLPQQFLDSKGQAIVKIYLGAVTIGGGATGPNPPLYSFQVTEDYAHPNDYYFASVQPTKVPRAVTPASDPTHIRVRLVNLGFNDPLDPAAQVPLTLAFADGTPVNPVTSGIAEGNWSDYVELPYGTYQFRVLADGIPVQVPAKPPQLTTIRGDYDPVITGGQVYVPTMTFQPGGAYSLAVSVNGNYQLDGGASAPLNSFVVQTDISPAANLTYARVQAVNAAEARGIHFQLDGADSAIGYGSASGYTTLVAGAHAMKITDAAGKVLIEKTITVKGDDNLTAWVYPATAGDSVTIVQNNMGGLRQQGVISDGGDVSNLIYNPLNFRALVQTRFLNLCPDLPYVTFTTDNGALMRELDFSSAAAAVNLQPGKPVDVSKVSYPYVDLGFGNYSKIEAFASQPSVVPGDRLRAVPDLGPSDFIHMPAYYYPGIIPGMEPGVYTVALIGRNKTGEQLRMIVIKHNL